MLRQPGRGPGRKCPGVSPGLLLEGEGSPPCRPEGDEPPQVEVPVLPLGPTLTGAGEPCALGLVETEQVGKWEEEGGGGTQGTGSTGRGYPTDTLPRTQ